MYIDYGVEKSVNVEGKNSDYVSDALQKLMRDGETMPK